MPSTAVLSGRKRFVCAFALSIALATSGLPGQSTPRVVHLDGAVLSSSPSWNFEVSASLGIDPVSGEVVVVGHRQGTGAPPAMWRVAPGAARVSAVSLAYPVPVPVSRTSVTRVSPNGRFALGSVSFRPVNVGGSTQLPLIWDLSNPAALPITIPAPASATCPGQPLYGYPAVQAPTYASDIGDDGTIIISTLSTGGAVFRRAYATGAVTPIGSIPTSGPPPDHACLKILMRAMSRDASVLVGNYNHARSGAALSPAIWTGNADGIALQTPHGWGRATDVSPDGTVVAGESPHDASFVNCEAGPVLWVDGIMKPILFPPSYTGHRCGDQVWVTDSGFITFRLFDAANEPVLFIGRADWPTALFLDDWFSQVGVSLPYPGFPGLTGRPIAVLDMASDATHLHLLVEATEDSVGGKRAFVVSVPTNHRSTVTTAFGLAGETWLMPIAQDLNHPRTTVFSVATALGAVGAGPIFGLHDLDLAPLLRQAMAPLGQIPFHIQPLAASEALGPWMLPAGIEVDTLSFSGSWPGLSVATDVHRFRVP